MEAAFTILIGKVIVILTSMFLYFIFLAGLNTAAKNQVNINL